MSSFDLASLLRPELSGIKSYSPDLRTYEIRLDANEAPPLLSANARARLAEVAGQAVWERYPDPTAGELRHAIAARVGATPEEILVGAGSDEVITLLMTALSRPRGALPATMLTVSPTFVMYRQNALIHGQRAVEIPLDDTWDLSVPALLKAVDETQPNVLFLASPNNPTGNLFSLDRLETVIRHAERSLVVIDEAYVDYSSRNQLGLFRRYPNVAVLRTLSKIGFASLRVGFILASPELTGELNKARSPYNLPALSQRLATLALTELAPEIATTVHAVVSERNRLATALGDMGVALTPSESNFLWLRTAAPAAAIQSALGERGIVVRSFHPHGGRLANQLRVTVGTARENDRFLTAMREILAVSR